MILNEKEKAEEILTSRRIATKADIMLISKYLRNEINCNVSETLVILSSIMTKINKNFNPIKSAKYLERIAKKAKGLPLKQVDNVKITSKELGMIGNIESLKLQRLLFVILVHSKINNKISKTNNSWTNISINELYKEAKVSTRNSKEKCLLLNKLMRMNFISFSSNNTNLNIRCNIVDDLYDKNSITINDVRELGYQYINLSNPREFIYCENCGVIMKKKGKKDTCTKLCQTCLKQSKNEINLNWFHQLDGADPSQLQ